MALATRDELNRRHSDYVLRKRALPTKGQGHRWHRSSELYIAMRFRSLGACRKSPASVHPVTMYRTARPRQPSPLQLSSWQCVCSRNRPTRSASQRRHPPMTDPWLSLSAPSKCSPAAGPFRTAPSATNRSPRHGEVRTETTRVELFEYIYILNAHYFCGLRVSNNTGDLPAHDPESYRSGSAPVITNNKKYKKIK